MLKLFLWDGSKRVLYPYPESDMNHSDPALPASSTLTDRDNFKRFKSGEDEEKKVFKSTPSYSLEENFELPELEDSTTELKYLRGKLVKMSECFIEYAEKSEEVHEYLKSKHLDESDQNKHNITLLDLVYKQFLTKEY